MPNIKPIVSRLGFEHRRGGHCMVSNDEQFIYIPIAKNASTFTEFLLETVCDWHYDDYVSNKNLLNKHIIVILRDPLKRWMAGVVEHFSERNNPISGVDLNNNALLHYVFNQCALDVHTELQLNFLAGVDTENCTFIKLDNTYSRVLEDFIEYRLGKKISIWGKDVATKYNKTVDKPFKQILLSYVKKYYDKNKEAQLGVLNYLRPDYDLINSLEFYNKIKSGI